jgi:tyrosine-protein phosphatase SIW14
MKPKRRRLHGATFALALVSIALGALSGCLSGGTHGDRDLPNLQQVNDTLYRGGQPTRDGFLRLQRMGVRTIASVRSSDIDSARLVGLDLDYQHRPMSPWRPRDEDVVWFLRLAGDPARVPLFLHCEHGSDRTGWLVAMHRIICEGWPRDRAIAEMTAEGNGFHDVYQSLIDYVHQADIERLQGMIAE